MTSATMTAPGQRVPELCAGDRLTRDEFERRYAAMPHCKKAELIEGVVYMGSPVNQVRHGGPHVRVTVWLGRYCVYTPGVDSGDNATVRLDLDNEPQPDLHARLVRGGKSTLSPEGYVEGAPELAVEITASRVNYDLHDKLRAYRRNAVQEYLVWRVDEGAIDWFVLRGGNYEPMELPADGILRSKVFPGLWLGVGALLRGDGIAVERVLDAGLASAEHAAFVARLAK
jgi:Uma2 family endonuclease